MAIVAKVVQEQVNLFPHSNSPLLSALTLFSLFLFPRYNNNDNKLLHRCSTLPQYHHNNNILRNTL